MADERHKNGDFNELYHESGHRETALINRSRIGWVVHLQEIDVHEERLVVVGVLLDVVDGVGGLLQLGIFRKSSHRDVTVSPIESNCLRYAQSSTCRGYLVFCRSNNYTLDSGGFL